MTKVSNEPMVLESLTVIYFIHTDRPVIMPDSPLYCNIKSATAIFSPPENKTQHRTGLAYNVHPYIFQWDVLSNIPDKISRKPQQVLVRLKNVQLCRIYYECKPPMLASTPLHSSWKKALPRSDLAFSGKP